MMANGESGAAETRPYKHNLFYRTMSDIKDEVRGIMSELIARVGEIEKRQAAQDGRLAKLTASHNEMAAMVEKELDALFDIDPDLEGLLNAPDDGDEQQEK